MHCMGDQEHRSQLLKGVLEMCLLALIDEEPRYGYEMVQKLDERGLSLVSDGSIYPSLSRLQKRSYVDGYFVETDGGGPPRKYYRITPTGVEALETWRSAWASVVAGVAGVMGGARDGR